MSSRILFRRPWIGVQVLSALLMLHACTLLSFIGRSQEAQIAAMSWVFFSLGACGTILGVLGRRWAGSSVVTWSGAAKLFGSIMLFSLAPAGHSAVYVSIALVILVAGIIHMLGALRLRRQDFSYRPFVASGVMNVVVSAVTLTALQSHIALATLPLVAGSIFTTGMTLFHYGRFLRRLTATNATLLERLNNVEIPATKHSRVRI